MNYDIAPYEHTLSVLEQAMEKKNSQGAPQTFMDAGKELSFLPYFRLFLSDLRQLNDGGEKDAAYMREQISAVRFIQELSVVYSTGHDPLPLGMKVPVHTGGSGSY